MDTLGGFEGDVEDLESLQSLLQAAVELEISTLPPYLSALYSMQPNSGKNVEIRKLIRSIIMEEMSHLALACNLLLATKGGEPRLAYKDVVKRVSFPRVGLASCKINHKGGKKTIHCLKDLELELLPMDIESRTDTKKKTAIDAFLAIEAPVKFKIFDHDHDHHHHHDHHKVARHKHGDEKMDEVKTSGDNNGDNSGDDPRRLVLFDKIGFSVSEKGTESLRVFTKLALSSDNIKNKDKIVKDKNLQFMSKKIIFLPTGAAHESIGSFYELIRKGFIHLSRKHGEKAIFNSKAHAMKTQAGPSLLHGLNFVYNLESALTAINTIVSEGEGTSLNDIWSDNEHLSHFHKFLEIKVGHPIGQVRRIENPGLGGKMEIPYEYIFTESVDIPFDKSGVDDEPEAWDWLKLGADNQKHNNEPRVREFNVTYGKLLILLQNLFGNSKLANKSEYDYDSFNEAIALMRQLQVNFNRCLRPEPENWSSTGHTSVAPNWAPPESMLL